MLLKVDKDSASIP